MPVNEYVKSKYSWVAIYPRKNMFSDFLLYVIVAFWHWGIISVGIVDFKKLPFDLNILTQNKYNFYNY